MSLTAAAVTTCCSRCGRPIGRSPFVTTHDKQPVCTSCVRRRHVHPVSALTESGLSRPYLGGFRPPRPPR